MSSLQSDMTEMEEHFEGIMSSSSPDTMLPLPDGVLSFTHRLVVELAQNFLAKHHQGQITELYIDDLQQNIETLLQQAGERSDREELACTRELAKMIPCVVPRLAFLVECLSLIRSPDMGRKPSKKDFKTSKLISSGAFGAVYLVRHRDTRFVFAMKKLAKLDLHHNDTLDLAYLERDIMMFTASPFVVNMVCSFQSQYHLCMIMDYVGGGDCATLLETRGPLSVNLARLYFAEMVLAVEHLHSYGVVHRDLKPENLLIAPSGHIKVSDFGLSKLGVMRLENNSYKTQLDDITKEFCDNEICGTLDYIAPEAHLQEGYGKPIDWWATGIILYEFLLGDVPFNADDKDYNINWNFDDKAPPPEAQDIITELLRENPAYRLGTGGAHEVKMHPFMSDLELDCILSISPEYIPQLVSDKDTSHFTPHSMKDWIMDKSDEEETSEGIEYKEYEPFTSSSKRFSNLCTNTPRTTDNNMENPKSSPEDSPEDSDSDMQRQPTSSDAEKQRHSDRSHLPSSSTVPAPPAKKKLGLSFYRTGHDNVLEPEERRSRGSVIRRVLSSCRRGLSRAARRIGRSCAAFSCCHSSSTI